MGVSKNNGTPKWMVKIREHPIKMDDLGVSPLLLETSILHFPTFVVMLPLETTESLAGHVSNEKRAPACLGFIGEYTTQLCGG